MWNNLIRLLKPPVFPDEENKTRAAGYVHMISLLFMTAILAYIVLSKFFAGVFTFNIFDAALIGIFLGIFAIAYASRAGYVSQAGTLLVTILWVAVNGTAFYGAGVRDSSFIANFAVLLAAGLLVGWKVAVALSALTVAAGIVLAYAEVFGVSPSIYVPISPLTVMWEMAAIFIIFAIFNGASPVIIDATAGERERGSLEPLLINPLPRGLVAVSKMLSAMPFALANLLITLAGFSAIFRILPIEELLGVQIGLSGAALGSIFLICLPIVLLACAIQTLIASFTKTTKEAGTYLPFIGLIPSLPGIALAFLPVKPALWAMLIPTFGQQILINQFLRSEPISGLNIAVSAVLTILLSVVITFIAIKLYQGERIIKG